MIDLVEEPLDSRIVQYLNESPENDGKSRDLNTIKKKNASGRFLTQCLHHLIS